MNKPKNKQRKPMWLLTIASAYAVLPACGDDDPTPAHEFDGGSVVRPTDGGLGLDAGIVIRHVDAAGIFVTPPDASVDGAVD